MGRVLWPVLIALALIFAVVVTATGEETRSELEYLDEIKAQSAALARGGASIREVMPRLREIDRDEFTTVFDGVAADLAVADAFVADEPPTESLIPVWALYRQAIQAWDDGVAELSSGILQAADVPQDSTAGDTIGDGLADLRAGDNLFVDLQMEFERAEVPEPVTPLGIVLLSPGEGGLSSLSATYAAAARSSTNNLGMLPGLKVSQILTSPSWQLNIEGQPIVAATEEIMFSVVVTNVGNVESTLETVAMTLTGGVEPVRAEEEVPVLRPNGQTTIDFEPVPVEPELLYRVEVEVFVNGADGDFTDNKLLIEFTVNAN